MPRPRRSSACARVTTAGAAAGDSGRRRVASTAALNLGVHLMWRAGRATDHDGVIGRKLAHIFGGGNVPHATTVTEQYLLDLEREAFMSLLGERKTLEAHPAHVEDRQTAAKLMKAHHRQGERDANRSDPRPAGPMGMERPTVDALAKHHRVITFSLCDERTARSLAIREGVRELHRAGGSCARPRRHRRGGRSPASRMAA